MVFSAPVSYISGFWGSCFNDYRRTKPHDGYYIIKSWKEKFFSNESSMKKRMYEIEKPSTDSDSEIDQLSSDVSNLNIEDKAGPFFIFTSNVENST